ncbi:MAG: hypothetical protein EVA21_06005 [Alphaproteobacteria bacterium]|nr:MAG: hypothetical protein EVA21_06005 [Alphaproteobacteria bacterium]
MEIIALLSCLLIIVHIFCPMFIGLLTTKDVSINYLFSSRDEEIKPSIYLERSKRAFTNLLETFPIFIILFFLSMIKQVDVTNLGLFWLLFRLIYIPSYIFGLKYIRTLVWMISFVILILIGIKFI